MPEVVVRSRRARPARGGLGRSRSLVVLLAPLGALSASFVMVTFAGCAGAGSKNVPDAAEVVDAATVDVIEEAIVEAGPPDAGHGNLTKVGATAQTSVLDAPWWPESGKGSKRVGYLRHGAVVEAFDHPVVNSDCKEGWYELAIGGYVCGKAVLTELSSPKIRLAPKQPDHDAGMPYRYGVNVSDDTPLYRRVLTTDERKKYEPWLAPPKPAPDESAASGDEKTEGASDEESAAPRKESKESKDSKEKDGRPKLKELKGKGVLVRKMARGFYLALDKQFRGGGARWWRTTFGFAVPFERIMLQSGVTKHAGTWFNLDAKAEVDGPFASLLNADGDAGSDAEAGTSADGGAITTATTTTTTTADAGDGSDAVSLAGTVAFVNVGFARKLEVSADHKKVTWGPELPKRSAVMLTGREATVQGQTYHQTTGGFWVRLMDLKTAHPAPPADVRPDEKWLDVDLTRQALVAFEGARPVFATLISSGRRNPQDKEHDFPTPPGTYRIREKHVTTTMDGDVASDGPYSIDDVPWVMYFQGSYALHGAFWHDQFGNMRSHGCVNMAPDDARTVFAWSDPPLPVGWHGVFSKDDQSGTRVIVHEDKRTKR